MNPVRWLLWKLIRSTFLAALVIETGGFGREAIVTQNMFGVATK